VGLLIIGLVLFVSLVIVHEYGHYKAARRGGVDVEEFGIGFPPRLWGRKLKSKMLLSINLLPIGGFVRLKGEHDADKGPGTYGSAPLKTKVKIMTAGVVMNLLTALAVLTFLALVGMPKIVENQFSVKSDSRVVKQEVLVGYVEPNSPAEKVGLRQGDRLLKLGLNKDSLASVNQVNNFAPLTKEFAGKDVMLTISRAGETQTLKAQLRSVEEVETSLSTENPKGYLGIVPTEYVVQRSTWSAPVVAVGTAGQFTGLTAKGLATVLKDLFTGNASRAADQVSGPVGIFVIIKEGASLGFQFILMVIAIISLTLAIMNILPIPALDGGRLFVTLLYRGLERPLTRETEEKIHGIGFAVLMLLFVVITVVDVRRFF